MISCNHTDRNPVLGWHTETNSIHFLSPINLFSSFFHFYMVLISNAIPKVFLVSSYLLGWETKLYLSQKRELHSPVKQIHNQPEHDLPFGSQSCKYFVIHPSMDVPSVLCKNYSSNDCQETINLETPFIKLLMYKSRRYSKFAFSLFLLFQLATYTIYVVSSLIKPTSQPLFMKNKC